ncbi:neuroblastoma breakpoint family member 12 isoform X1 [Fukomys damarensis]|uniref:neuroblastoma breakpoint family member 12 isoform X1 n=1 Tax=Fukomys damarensis TaxID=885580 RepID=UPI00053F4ED2|nr:neuroblastoma breakpoint family member 12 isoform X1 [Fukomys damarensis]XP_010616682.1 neuroblastoma breakpoint family member 12 isoform X1 [Fukomys damarensis]XP_010616683.1 neuroblastoma breakpoint family member 12 isoform X1 [Fukomys damarensis]XP_010616684.1 neuroblastoma breakpoint family member 12 isoform X1 [Fukomys damarensis]XP_010616685.1 neuroblastoma breakpoint family member 12 isoform X1 [Fukomys damarensis]XP_010616686.1 neuroblastoma breakpoint family member 12 isoform X1 [F
MTCSDINQELNFQLEESQQQLRDMEANFHIAKATLYVLAAELRKFKSTKYKDVIDSVLGERLQPKEQELAEKLSLAEQLRESCILIGEQRRKLSQLRQQLEEGSNESLLLKEHLKAIPTRHDADPTLGRGLRGQLAEGCRLAEVLAGKSESLEEESGKDCQSLLPRVSTGGVDKQGEHVPRDWQDDDQEQPSGPGEPSDRPQPPCSAALPVDEISPSPDAAQPQDTLSQQEEEEEAGVTWYLEDGDDINDSLSYTLDRSYLMVSTCRDSPAPPKPSKTPVFLANQTPCEDEDAPEPEAPRKLMIGDQRRPPFLWTWCVTIQDNARKLTQHREQLRKGKEAAFSLGQCLRRLFTQEEPARAVQRHREELVEACKLADHLVLQLHIANCGSRTGKEEKEPLYQVDDQSSDFSFLIQAQARELTQLRKKLEAGRNVAFILQKHLKDLITDNDFGESQGQSLLQLAEWRRLAERLTLQLGSEHHCDTEDEEETESLDSSDEQQDEKVDELLSGSVAERSLLGPGRPDPPYQQQHCISVAVPAEEHEASPAQDGTSQGHSAHCHRGPCSSFGRRNLIFCSWCPVLSPRTLMPVCPTAQGL